MTETRRLAAILAADVVGYSRLMGEDEAGTAKAVREHREAATPIAREFGGRLVKTTGDGVLLEFPSVVAAVECAIAIQKQIVERNSGVPEGKHVLYRIGINLGCGPSDRATYPLLSLIDFTTVAGPTSSTSRMCQSGRSVGP